MKLCKHSWLHPFIPKQSPVDRSIDIALSTTRMGGGRQSRRHARLQGSTSCPNTSPACSWGSLSPASTGLVSLPSRRHSAWGSPYPETCGWGFQLLLQATPGWLKNGTVNNLRASRKIASEALYMELVFPESSGEEGGEPKWKLKLAKPSNALPTPQAAGRMRYYLFAYTSTVRTKPGRLGQQSMAVLEQKLQARPTCFNSTVNKQNKQKTLEIKSNCKEESIAEGLLWWQENTYGRWSEGTSPAEFWGRSDSTTLPDSHDLPWIIIWQAHNLWALWHLKGSGKSGCKSNIVNIKNGNNRGGVVIRLLLRLLI